jgi:hypothetical protein
MDNYLKYYDIERYLFDDAHQRFHTEHSLGAFDFFSIIVWKANRAKSKIAHKLLRHGADSQDLEPIVRSLTKSLYEAPDRKERLQLLMKQWNFALPMATAILCICWPNDFTIYDYRVRDLVPGQADLNNLTDFEKIWADYEKYTEKVIKAVPAGLSLRDADRYLWGKSAAQQLVHDLERQFSKDTPLHSQITPRQPTPAHQPTTYFPD